MITFLVIISALAIILRYIWSIRKIYALSLRLPGPIAWPFIGNVSKFLCKQEDFFDVLVGLINEYPSPCRIWLGPKCLFIFSDMCNVEKIICSMKFVDKDKIYDCMKELDGEGLIPASGSKWKRDRRLMGPFFLQKNVIEYFPIILKHSKRLVNVTEKYVDKNKFSVDKYLDKCVSDIVNETILGIKTDAQSGELDGFLKALSRIYIVGYSRMVNPWQQSKLLYKFCSNYREHEAIKKTLHDFMRSAIRKAVHKSELRNLPDNPVYKSFLDKMLSIRKDIPDFATEEEIVHHLTTLYTASEDTIMQISSYILVLLGMYPDIQEKVADEIKRTVGTRDVQLEDLNHLTYLEMCIKDVLRLFPIAPFIMRTPYEDVTVGNITVPKGCSILLSIQNIHRDPTLWEKPNSFYPEHFSFEAVQKRNPYAFLAFSGGPRGCLGKPYSYMALKTILVTFLQHYQVETDKKFDDIKLRCDISVRFKDDCYDIKIRRRC